MSDENERKDVNGMNERYIIESVIYIAAQSIDTKSLDERLLGYSAYFISATLGNTSLVPAHLQVNLLEEEDEKSEGSISKIAFQYLIATISTFRPLINN